MDMNWLLFQVNSLVSFSLQLLHCTVSLRFAEKKCSISHYADVFVHGRKHACMYINCGSCVPSQCFSWFHVVTLFTQPLILSFQLLKEMNKFRVVLFHVSNHDDDFDG